MTLPIDWRTQPLGKVSDVSLAETLGVSRLTVRAHRLALGIPRHRKEPTKSIRKPSIDWAAQPLGEMSDRAVAKLLGKTHVTVGIHRRALGIAPYREHPYLKPGTPHSPNPVLLDPDLGKSPDTLLAERYSLSRERIRQLREVLKIPAIRKTRKKLWQDSIDWASIPSEISNAQLAKDHGVPPYWVSEKRASTRRTIDWDSIPLGTKPDRLIAEEYGVRYRNVRTARINRGIPRVIARGFDYSKQPLGQVPDRVIAKTLGISPVSVAHARKMRGIPACCPHQTNKVP